MRWGPDCCGYNSLVAWAWRSVSLSLRFTFVNPADGSSAKALVLHQMGIKQNLAMVSESDATVRCLMEIMHEHFGVECEAIHHDIEKRPPDAGVNWVFRGRASVFRLRGLGIATETPNPKLKLTSGPGRGFGEVARMATSSASVVAMASSRLTQGTLHTSTHEPSGKGPRVVNFSS